MRAAPFRIEVAPEGDDVLVERVWEGNNSAAFAALYTRHARYIARRAAIRPGSVRPDLRAASDQLMREPDRARVEGRLVDALAALNALVRAYPKDPNAPLALFTIGRTELRRDEPARAARAFEAYVTRYPNGPLAEDALAEEASARSGA